jgi:RHS repeat-associated protein
LTQVGPDGWQLLEQRDGNNAVVTRYFSQGEQRLTGNAAGNYFYTCDHLGSVREFLDGSGAVRARYDYDAWGNRTKLSGDLECEIGFTGYWSHAPSGLYLSPTRAYSSALGRFISRDPLGEAGGLNLYAYVGNDPVNAVDPLGLITVGFYGMGGENTIGNVDFADLLLQLGGLSPLDRTQAGQNQALNAILAAKKKCPNEPVNILGYSRGSQAANQLAQKLKDLGINVDTLNVIDPVTIQGQPMHLTVPLNVQEANDYYQHNHSFMLNRDHPFKGGAFNNASYNPNVNSIDLSYLGVTHNTIVEKAAKFISGR